MNITPGLPQSIPRSLDTTLNQTWHLFLGRIKRKIGRMVDFFHCQVRPLPRKGVFTIMNYLLPKRVLEDFERWTGQVRAPRLPRPKNGTSPMTHRLGSFCLASQGGVHSIINHQWMVKSITVDDHKGWKSIGH